MPREIGAARLQAIERICQAALDHGPESRDAFLADACADDDGLRREIESLLAFESHARPFMESPAVVGPAYATSDGADEPSVSIGRVIGPYQVVSWLGTGGMGQCFALAPGWTAT